MLFSCVSCVEGLLTPHVYQVTSLQITWPRFLFYHEDGGYSFLLNAGNHQLDYTASPYSSTFKIVAAGSSEMFITIYQTTWRHETVILKTTASFLTRTLSHYLSVLISHDIISRIMQHGLVLCCNSFTSLLCHNNAANDRFVRASNAPHAFLRPTPHPALQCQFLRITQEGRQHALSFIRAPFYIIIYCSVFMALKP